jgi:hypothetical protein
MTNHRAVAVVLVAVVAGALSPLLLAAAQSSVGSLIEPSHRISRFLSPGLPHHPVQLAVAAWGVCMLGGACAGLAMRWLIAHGPAGRPGPVEMAFFGGLAASLLLLAVQHGSMPALSWWGHVVLFAVVAATTLRLPAHASALRRVR